MPHSWEYKKDGHKILLVGWREFNVFHTTKEGLLCASRIIDSIWEFVREPIAQYIFLKIKIIDDNKCIVIEQRTTDYLTDRGVKRLYEGYEKT